MGMRRKAIEKGSRSIAALWPMALVFCACTYDFDRFAPNTATAPDGGLPVDAGVEQPYRDVGSHFDDGNGAVTMDAATSADDAFSIEGGEACKDAQSSPEASTAVCPPLKPAEGDGCDRSVSNRTCRFGRSMCTCASCRWTCQ